MITDTADPSEPLRAGNFVAPRGGAETARRFDTIAVLAILGITIFTRIYLLATTDFPINDGALFQQFVIESAASFPALPAYVPFNGLDIPFAYPPLAFWLAGGLTKLGFGSLSVVHVVPLVMNIVYVILITLLLYRLGYSSVLIALSLFFFSTNLRSFEWLIMGGGLARGLGALFTILALFALARPRGDKGPGPSLATLALAGAAVAGAVLSHPQWGLLAAAFVLALLGVQAATIKALVVRGFVVGTTASLLVLPWAVHILQVHGPEPFVAAASSSERNILVETFVNLAKAVAINPFIALGAIYFALRREFFWLLVTILSILITPRLAVSAWALPMAIFAAQGVISSIPIVQKLVRNRAAATALVVVAALCVVAFRVERDVRLSGQYYKPLKPGLRDAMTWVAKNHPGRDFAVLSLAPWYYDASAEWFPQLTGARSVVTVQGREWLPGREYERWVALSKAQKESSGCADLMNNLRPFGTFDFVWAETHRACFLQAPVFANADVAIYRVR